MGKWFRWFLIGYVASEIASAVLGYNGIFIGKIVVSFLEDPKRRDMVERDLWYDIRLWLQGSNSARFVSEPLKEEQGCEMVRSLQQLVVWYYQSEFLIGGRVLSYGETPPAVCTPAHLDKSTHKDTFGDSIIIRWNDGPTCKFGHCAIDVLRIVNERVAVDEMEIVRRVLSARVPKGSSIALGLTYTNGTRDIVLANKYRFVWNGKQYVRGD